MKAFFRRLFGRFPSMHDQRDNLINENIRLFREAEKLEQRLAIMEKLLTIMEKQVDEDLEFDGFAFTHIPKNKKDNNQKS